MSSGPTRVTIYYANQAVVSRLMKLTIRLFKEEQVYREEVAQREAVLSRLKTEEADGADIRNAVSIGFYAVERN